MDQHRPWMPKPTRKESSRSSWAARRISREFYKATVPQKVWEGSTVAQQQIWTSIPVERLHHQSNHPRTFNRNVQQWIVATLSTTRLMSPSTPFTSCPRSRESAMWSTRPNRLWKCPTFPLCRSICERFRPRGQQHLANWKESSLEIGRSRSS